MGELSTIYKNNNKLYASFTIFPKNNFSNDNLTTIEGYLDNNNINYFASGNLFMQQKIIDYILLILLFIPPTALNIIGI